MSARCEVVWNHYVLCENIIRHFGAEDLTSQAILIVYYEVDVWLILLGQFLSLVEQDHDVFLED